MTDNEIIKTLKRIAQYSGFTDDVSNTLLSALDLINRQKTENESLKVDLAKYSIRLDNLYKTADKIKSEAIKECLEKVKNYVKAHCNPYGKPDFDYDTSLKILNFIDNLIKEMTEVNENEIKNNICTRTI